ncbi:MAG: RNA methyltransferase [Candidatus Micrarchaeia archaeon]
MPSFRIVLVQPTYEINLGHCARVMSNFGFEELVLVAPECDPRGFDAKKYAKHGVEVLERARVVDGFADAVRGCDLVVGTTGVLKRSPSTLRNPITPKLFAQRMRSFAGKVALVFGREGSGLTADEIKACDFMVSIPASRRYRVLNLSHALAILLYELHALKKPRMIRLARKEEREALEEMFGKMVNLTGPWRGPGKIKLAFRRVLSRALITDAESAALIGVFRRAAERLGASVP